MDLSKVLETISIQITVFDVVGIAAIVVTLVLLVVWGLTDGQP